jgi:hypothetical protein
VRESVTDIILTPETAQAVLDRFRGFHDAEYGEMRLIPHPGGVGCFCCFLRLRAYDRQLNELVSVEFRLDGVAEFQIIYHSNFDYPNIRDEVAIGYFESKFFINFGFAFEEQRSAADYRGARIHFVCETVTLRVAERFPSTDC